MTLVLRSSSQGAPEYVIRHDNVIINLSSNYDIIMMIKVQSCCTRTVSLIFTGIIFRSHRRI